MSEIAITKDMSIKACVMMAQTDIDTFCAELSTSSFCPANFKGNPIDIKFAILWGAELGLNAFQSVTGIKVINGKPTLYGDILLAVCKSNPEWVDMIETYDESKQTAYCEVRRKGHEPMIRSFSYANAQTAKLIRQGPWMSYPTRMLQHRARGFALRDMYADSLCGLIDHTEAEDYPVKDVTPPIPENDFEVDYIVAELGQLIINNQENETRALLEGISADIKKRLWARLPDNYKTFIKNCIANKPKVNQDV